MVNATECHARVESSGGSRGRGGGEGGVLTSIYKDKLPLHLTKLPK